jgi:hypothetical protein
LICFAKKNYGLNEKSLEIIIIGAILPIISYCSSVFYEAIDRKFFIEPLIRCQRLLGHRLIKAYKTVSADATNIIANLIPIDLYLKGKAVEYFVKQNIENE